jgi:cytochrome P450
VRDVVDDLDRRRADRYPIGARVTVAELEAAPYALLARLREREPVSWLPAVQAWLVTPHSRVLEVIRDAEAFTVDDPRFSTSQVIGPSMLSLDGEAHARHRRPFARPFRLNVIRERFTQFVEDETDRLLDGIAGAREAEVRTALAGPLSVATMVEALGLAETDPAVALGWYAAIVDAVTAISAGNRPGAAGAEAFAALAAAVDLALDRDPASSLVAAAASDAGGLDRTEVVANAAVLLFGGIETTEAMIANAVLHLFSAPDELERVAADPTLVAAAVEESLRLEPAAAVLDRYATRELALGDAEIRRGELVRVSLTAANRDPSVFADPDRFDPGRANVNRQLAFGQGPHICLGMHLARLEARVAVARLLERFPQVRLDPGRPATITGLIFRKPAELHVVW